MSWKDIHAHYEEQDWIGKPSIFAQEAILYFPPIGGKILEIGAGLGQDSRYFHEQGFNIISSDFSEEVLQKNRLRSATHISSGRYQTAVLDVSKLLPFDDDSFDGVFAHLSLHYFSSAETNSILGELKRVLKPGGIIAILLNSTHDPEYGNGNLLEEDYYQFGEIKKRFFSLDSAGAFFLPYFEKILLDNQGETYKDREKGIHNLIRFIGKKV